MKLPEKRPRFPVYWLPLTGIFALATTMMCCALVNLEELAYKTYPAKRNQVIAQNEPVWIDFSISLDKNQAESCLRISSSSGKQNGDLSWRGKRLYFNPVPGWEPGKQYLFSFEGQVQSTDGRSFPVKHLLYFYAGTDDFPPTITDATPTIESGDMTGIHTPLQITFSKPINTESFKTAFSLTPTVVYTTTWTNENTTVTITPEDQWTNLQAYTWQVSTVLKDDRGIALFQPFSGSFLPAEDSVPPYVMYVVPAPDCRETGLPEVPVMNMGLDTLDGTINYNDVIQIAFSEPVRFDTLQKAFSLETTGGTEVNGTLYELPGQTDPPYPSRFFIFKPQDYFLNGEWYHLSIDRSVEDLSGNPLCPEYHDRFRANILYLEVESITFLNAVSSATGEPVKIEENQFSTYVPQSVPFPEDTDSLNYRVHIVFKRNGIGGLIRDSATTQTLLDAINCPCVFPSLNPLEIQDINIVATPSGRFYELDINFFCIINNPVAGQDIYYKFIIKGGPDSIRSAEGAYLKDDVFIYLKIEGPTA